MASIDRLELQGIRAFGSATEASRIDFQTPLTLIVGHNGSGKTTIIECLKYITCGTFPPSANGAPFVHDPLLDNESRTSAMIRLRFTAATGGEITGARTMQVEAKKAGRAFKNLNNTVSGKLNGEKYSKNLSVTQMDTEMPILLGISKAILDNVIFCHQEESSWPLGQPSDLKKKFDEIFEAQKYTKAIDHIKVLRKRQAEKLIAHKKDEEYLKVSKHKGQDVFNECNNLEAEIKRLKERMNVLSEQMSDAYAKAEGARDKAIKAGDVVYKLEGKRIEERSKVESVESLHQTLQELEGSDQSLQDMLEQYEQRMSIYQEERDEQKARYNDLGQSINELRGRLSAKERECGSYEAQQNTHERRIEMRKKLVKEAAHRHEIRGFDLDVNDEQVKSFVDRITKMARDQNAAFERARRETQEDLQKAQKVLNQISDQRTSLTSHKDNARQIIIGNDRKLDDVRKQLDTIQVDEGGRVALESDMQETQTRLQAAKDAGQLGGWQEKIQSTEVELRELEDAKQKLEDELIEATRSAGDSARIDFIKKELKDRQRRLETMTGAHSDRIGSVVGPHWQPSNVESAFQKAVEQANILVLEAQKQRDGTTREMEQIDFKLTTCRSDLKSKAAQVASAATSIGKVIEGGPEEYQIEVQNLEENRNIIKSDADSFGMMMQYFDQCLKDAEEHKVCRTCTRGFTKDKEIDALKKSVDRQRRKFDIDAASKDLKDIEDQLAAAKALSTEFDTWERLREKEVPVLEKEEKRLNEQRERLLAQLEQQDGIVSEKTAGRRDVEALAKTVASIAKYASEISNFEAAIGDLVSKQKGTRASRGLEAIQDESTNVKDEERVVKMRLAALRNDKEKAERSINILELELRDIQRELGNTNYQLKEKKTLEDQVEEFKSLNEEQRQRIKTSDQDLQALIPQLSQAQAKYEDVSNRGRDRDDELRAETESLNNSLNQLQMADEEIRAYLERGGSEQLKRAKEEVQSLHAQVASIEQKQQHVVRDVKALDDKLNNHSDTRRSIVDNLRFRRDQRGLEIVREEIQELESHDAESEKEYYSQEAQKWQTRHDKLSGDKSHLTGECKSKDLQLEQRNLEYEKVYKDAAHRYREAHVTVETTKACIEDLGRYGGALDKAIMKYHSIKMEEVNRIIDELWRKTYQGTDVDTIFIKSDNENLKGNKSYNYRVCMVKQATEMDMRGRCSAGQKVLACIIIRLALAECFGVNFGLIALDEPTTNLDRDNIQALAQSIADLIHVRKAQKNFQIIVITHDEDFLRYMNCSDYADVYWRVKRDERQKSKIVKEQIYQLM